MKARINKLISEALSASRRDAEEYIKQKRVKINGKIARLGDTVTEGDVVLFDQVDLPVVDLLKQIEMDDKQNSYDKKKEERYKAREKSRREERGESQRINASAKSAALRKTSKNNPENKKHRQEWREDEYASLTGRYKEARKTSRQQGRSGNARARRFSDWDD